MKKLFKITLITFLLLTCVSCKKKTIEEGVTVEETVEKVDYREIYKDEIEKVNEYVEINNDFLGLLNVGNGLIVDDIIVRDIDNNEYIRKDFYTKEYSIYGTSFMDYRNNPNFKTDKNVILYGHYVYSYLRDDEHMFFTNLEQLIDKENYEDNKTATLLTRDGIREYVVARVFYINENDLYNFIGPLYYIIDFSEEEFSNYLKEIDKVQFYGTGVDLEYEDHLLTLQTCVENRSELRLIVVLKETNRINFND